MSFMMPKPPSFNPNLAASVGRPPPVPVFGKDLAGEELRTEGKKAQARAFSGSLMGSQLQAATTGGKTLLGQAG